MKNIFAFILLSIIASNASAQTAMTIHLSNGGAQTFLLSNIDSITYGTPSSGNYTIGSTGPGGGIVFYDKGTFSNGWRYMEIYNSFLNNAEWGCQQTNVAGTSANIGTGYENTQLIVNACSTPGIAARICNNLSVVVNGVTINDWFLPSADELNQVFMNLSVIPFIENTRGVNFTSTQENSTLAYIIDMTNGSYSNLIKGNSLSTIAVRRF